jgi:hypothetical protein
MTNDRSDCVGVKVQRLSRMLGPFSATPALTLTAETPIGRPYRLMVITDDLASLSNMCLLETFLPVVEKVLNDIALRDRNSIRSGLIGFRPVFAGRRYHVSTRVVHYSVEYSPAPVDGRCQTP